MRTVNPCISLYSIWGWWWGPELILRCIEGQHQKKKNFRNFFLSLVCIIQEGSHVFIKEMVYYMHIYMH